MNRKKKYGTRFSVVSRFVIALLLAFLWESSAQAASTLNLSWQDNSSDESGFNIERATSSAGPFTKIAALGANATSYSDTNLAEATTFCYRTNAFNTAGASPYTNVVCGMTKATLNVAKAGSGSGRIVSAPAGINCDASCSLQFNGNSTVTLTAMTSAGSVFTGWSGACTGMAPMCTVTMNSQKSVAANFYSDTLSFAGSRTSTGTGFLAGGIEGSGSARGPAFQLFNPSGTLQTTAFALGTDFTDVSFVLGNFDADAPDEVLVGGRETAGLARGPAYQIFEANGAFKFTRFVLNSNFTDVTFSPLNVGSNGVLVCGEEATGPSRGPAYQIYNSGGTLVRTQFVLNPDFTSEHACVGTDLDGSAGDEVIVIGREGAGLARGPAFQIFGSDGTLRATRFVLNPNFRETALTIMDTGGNKNLVVAGLETSGALRGPAYQTYDVNGNLLVTRFILNPDFTELQVFGANTSNALAGEEIVTGGTETGGLARGPALQVWDKNGNHLFTRFVLNPDFTEVKFSRIDVNNDGLDELLVVGIESRGLARGPALQLFDASGNLLLSKFVLNPDFTNLHAFAVDQDADGNKEIAIGGVETSGLRRGPAYQIFNSSGSLVQTQFVLNSNF